jgi:hypothetical protein
MFYSSISLQGSESPVGRAESASGPTTTCEIETFDPEPQLNLPFDSENMYVILPCLRFMSFIHHIIRVLKIIIEASAIMQLRQHSEILCISASHRGSGMLSQR